MEVLTIIFFRTTPVKFWNWTSTQIMLSPFYSCTPLPQVSPDSLMPRNLRGTIDGFSGLLSREGIVSHWVQPRLHHIFMCVFVQLFVTQLLCTEIICGQTFSQVDKKFNWHKQHDQRGRQSPRYDPHGQMWRLLYLKNIFSYRQLQSRMGYFWSICLPVCTFLHTCLCIDGFFVFIYRGDLSPSIFVFFSMYLLLSVIQQFKSCLGP